MTTASPTPDLFLVIFERMLPVASNKGARFVALNRRHYPGSTEYRSGELNIVVSGGTEEEKDAELQARGIEIATFIDNFIQINDLPPISEDRKTGGIILLGWSLGSVTAFATIASAGALPSDTRARLGARIRSIIVYGDRYSFPLLVNVVHYLHEQTPPPSFLGFPLLNRTGRP